MIKLIVAISKNRVIGDSNKLIWNLPADLKRFKEITTGHPIVMGRKTFQSIGRPLPNRRNIIITRDDSYEVEGCEIVNSIEEALLLTNNDCFIIWGGEIYKQTLHLSDQIYMTIVDEEFEGDTTFPELPTSWYVSKQENFSSDEKNPHNYSFIFYEKYNSKGKLIMIIGAPASGKSTLAAEVHTELKKRNKNSIFISEVATDFIAEWGIPNSPIDQVVIFYKQLNKETMFLDSKEFIICDSSSILNYFYFRQLFPEKLSNKDIASINHLQKEILKHINTIDHVFYLPPMRDIDTNDGIRYHNDDDITRLDRWIKSYLELENINHTDLSNIDMKKRVDFILKDIV